MRQLFLLLLLAASLAFVLAQTFSCAPRCQCYADPEHPSYMHLVCKWDQLNTTNLNSLPRPDLVRTLTIRCPHQYRKPSTPHAGMFQGLQNLERLELDRCQISYLPEALFAGLGQLYSLIVRNANMTDIPRELFAHVPNLMTLDLSGNKLRIEPYSLRYLSNLVHLDLSENDIAFLTNTLIPLTMLRVVTIDRNKITNIDFRRLPEELTDLSLRNNWISTIHYVPNSARHLRRLDLAGNRLEFFAGAGSSAYINVLPASLRFVDLSSNKINFLHESAMQHMQKMAVLDLQNNSLREVKMENLLGSKVSLRVYLSKNPLRCHCNIRWMLHATEKLSPTVADVSTVTCESIVDPSRVSLLTLADARNELLCKYKNICEAECPCCSAVECPCRRDCPPPCQCLRSANTASTKTAQNVIICDSMRFDKLGVLPSSLTELRLNNSDWKHFPIASMSSYTKLSSLKISNSPITDKELETLLSVAPSLTHLEVSAGSLTSIPKVSLSSLTRLHLHSNPLSQPSTEQLHFLDGLKKVSLGGNATNFLCSCELPTDLQRWASRQENREKIDDFDEVYCELKGFGVVRLEDALPGNGSLCVEPTEDMLKWMNFVDNTQQRQFEQTSTTATSAVITETSSTIAVEVVTEKEKPKSTTFPTTRRSETSTPKSTTSSSSTTASKTRKKYRDVENEPLKFVNILIFILFICVIVLIIAIGFTIYFKFLNTDTGKSRRHHESEPLNET